VIRSAAEPELGPEGHDLTVRSMVRSRLAIKIAVLIVIVLIFGFGASTVLTIQREAELLLDQNKMAARRLTAAIVASVEGAMLQERPDVTRMVIQELKQLQPLRTAGVPLEGLEIYRRNGVEAFTDLATVSEVMKNADIPPDVLTSIQKMQSVPAPGPSPTSEPLFFRAVETVRTQEALETRGGVPLFTMYHPIPNQEKCQGCHGSDHRVRAVVRVATSMEPVFAKVREQRNRQIAIGLVTILVAAAVLTVAMRQVVLRPLAALSTVARRIGEGDFEARAPAGARDEIGELGATFNEMTARLAGAYQDLEGKYLELATALQNLQESRQRLALLEQLKGELSKFVPESVKKLLEQNPNATELEKKSVEVSVLFLDIAGYTRLSEQLDPKRLNQLVQTYFSSFLEIIQGHHGDVNETAGDGLMVIFQSDRNATDHALNATRAAFAIRQRTAGLNAEYEGVFPPIELHMGLNTGEALVGATKLGGAGSQRWTFTATGPTTNTAARFAGSAQGGEIVVGPATAERIRRDFVLEDLGERTFKNVSQPIRVFRVIPPGVYEKVV
jgi:class 3 adenylate cyclase/HAMP domain-containing protein